MKRLRFAETWVLIWSLEFLAVKQYNCQLVFSNTNVAEDNLTYGLLTTTERISSNGAASVLPDDDDEEENLETTEKSFYDYDDEEEQVVSTNQTKVKTGIVYTWAKWPKWNKCSRTCGGGIQIRIRNCIEKKQTGTELLITEFQPGTDGRRGCFGILKKFRICNMKPCPKNEDFRDQQCATYNKIPYKGKLYEWEAYNREHHECELNCKPVNLNYYTTLNKWVVDGTPCVRPSVYYTHSYRGRAVCVEGICKVSTRNNNNRLEHHSAARSI